MNETLKILKRFGAEDLKRMQAFSLDRKIEFAKANIREWYEKWDGKVYVSFSGGKDSTVKIRLVTNARQKGKHSAVEDAFVGAGTYENSRYACTKYKPLLDVDFRISNEKNKNYRSYRSCPAHKRNVQQAETLQRLHLSRY